MISFRYHLVTIAAVLLALAAGVALGAGPLDDGSVLSGDDSGSESADPAVARFESGYATRTSGSLLKNALKGESVVVLTLPGARADETKGVRANIEQAGGTITGEVQFTGKLVDPANRQFAEGVAQQSAADVSGVSGSGDSYTRIGAALGRSVLGAAGKKLDTTANTIGAAFDEGQLVTYTTKPSTFAGLAVVIAGPGRAGDAATVSAQLAKAIDGAGKGAVLAGPSTSSQDGGVLASLRDSDAVSQVSTVDVTDTAAGRVVVALALAREADGQSGSWGTSRSADGALPR